VWFDHEDVMLRRSNFLACFAALHNVAAGQLLPICNTQGGGGPKFVLAGAEMVLRKFYANSRHPYPKTFPG
jgi:hypothetical protein